MFKPLLHKTTAERSEKELQIAYEMYIESKTVNGRFCPTPDLHTYEVEDLELDDFHNVSSREKQNYYTLERV